MSEITPADFAKFTHRVPDGAVIPANTEYVWLDGMSLRLAVHIRYITQLPGEVARWTAEPIPAPTEQIPMPAPTLAERARVVARRSAAGSNFDQLAAIVAELADRLEQNDGPCPGCGHRLHAFDACSSCSCTDLPRGVVR